MTRYVQKKNPVERLRGFSGPTARGQTVGVTQVFSNSDTAAWFLLGRWVTAQSRVLVGARVLSDSQVSRPGHRVGGGCLISASGGAGRFSVFGITSLNLAACLIVPVLYYSAFREQTHGRGERTGTHQTVESAAPPRTGGPLNHGCLAED